MNINRFKALFIFFVCTIVFVAPSNASAKSRYAEYALEVATETKAIWRKQLLEPLSKIWDPWFNAKTIQVNLSYLKSDKVKQENLEDRAGQVLAFSTVAQTGPAQVTKEEVLNWLRDLFLLQQTKIYSAQPVAQQAAPNVYNYYSSGVTQGLADSVGRSVKEINTSIGGDLDTLEANSVFNTSVLSVDTVNTRVGIGTSTPTDTLSVNGAAYFAQISAPSNTSNRLYNTGGNLYWAGNLIGGASTGVWETDGTHVWRAAGSVGVGTTSPFAKLSVESTAGSAQFVIGSSTATQFIVDKNGNVGIGSAAPTSKLYIADAAGSAFNGLTIRNDFVTQAIGNTASLTLSVNNTVSETASIAAITENITSGQRQTGLQFVTSSATTGNTEKMRITGLGNVGIGTTTPSTPLAVLGNIGGDVVRFINISSPTTEYFTAQAGGVYKGFIGTGAVPFRIDNTSGNILLQTTGGNVGIGTTTPGSSLDVYGSSGLRVLNSQMRGVKLGFTSNIGSVDLVGDGNYSGMINFQRTLGTSIGNIIFDQPTQAFQFTNTLSSPWVFMNGNVGIGTTSPASKLHVEGTATTELRVKTSATNVGAYLNITNPTGGDFWIGREGSGGGNILTGATGYAAVIADRNGNPLQFGTSDVVRMTILPTTGNIGMGTTSPYAKLSIHANNGEINRALFDISSSTAAATTSLFTVLSNGNVGIGTSNPGQKLDVNGNIAIQQISNDPTLQITAITSGTARLNMTGAGGGAAAINGVSTDLYFQTNSASRMVVKATTGNVGIGTTSPFAKLSVESAAGVAQFAIGSSTATSFIVDKNGNVGVGTANPGFLLHVNGNSMIGATVPTYIPSAPLNLVNSAGGNMKTQLTLVNTGGGNGAGSAIDFFTYDLNGGTSPGLRIAAYDNNYSADFTIFTKVPGNEGNALTERLRVTNAGLVGIGTSTPWRTLSVNGTVAMPGLVNDSTGYYVCLNTTTGQMATSTTACGASSERFKENIQDITYGLNEVLGLRPVSFDYKADYIPNAPKQLGFIAEEVDLLVPELVARNDSGEIQGLDYPKFTALLVRAVQEVSAKLDTLVSQMQTALAWFTSDGKFKVQNDICVDDVCVTKDQFKQILLDSAVGATQYMNTPEVPVETQSETQTQEDNTASSTPEIIPNTPEENASTTPDIVPSASEDTPSKTASTTPSTE